MRDETRAAGLQGFYSRHWGKLWLAQAIVFLIVGFSIASMMSGGGQGEAAEDQAAASATPTIWTCAMHPQIRRDGPGQCPLCGMDLVPVKPSAGGIRTITISPAARKLLNIQTSPVTRRYVTADIRMVGKVEYDETRLSHITAWVSGRLDRLYVDYTGVEVKKGDHLVYIYSEELYAAQEELIQAIKYSRDRPSRTTTLIKPIDLVASSREKLRLLGLTQEQIAEIEARGKPTDHVTIFSPIGGIVVKKIKQQGDRVRTGDRIYTVADLTKVWVKLDAYESDLQWLRYGQEVEFTTDAYPGKSFFGRIAFIDRVLDPNTRTVKVRVNVANENALLKPEMFVRATVRSHFAAGGRVLDASLAGKWISPMHPEIVKDEPGACDICGMPLIRADSLGYIGSDPSTSAKPLVIPVSAALVTGRRAIVYVENPTAKEPTYEGREVVLGRGAGEYYLVAGGLTEGELVVTNGNFKLDSALQISAKPSMMTPDGGGGSKQAASTKANVALPAIFKSQFEQLKADHQKVEAAIEQADTQQIRASFKQLQASVAQVDEKQLAGHAKMLWREFGMLLSNDAMIGSEVRKLQDADNAFLRLSQDLDRASNAFGLAPDEHPHVLRVEVPAAFQTQLARLWPAYRGIADALAADDYSAAMRSTKQAPAIVASIKAEGLTDSAKAAWDRERKSMDKILSDLNRASDIKSARAAFVLLSDELLAIVRIFGIGDVGPMYELHCPMAFDNRGAGWLQANDKIRNPYFGAAMLKCADRVSLLDQFANEGAKKKANAQGHDGHNHP